MEAKRTHTHTPVLGHLLQEQAKLKLKHFSAQLALKLPSEPHEGSLHIGGFERRCLATE